MTDVRTAIAVIFAAFLLAFVAAFLAGCASLPEYARPATVPVVVDLHAGHTLTVNVVVMCDGGPIREKRYRAVRSGQRLDLPVCGRAVIGVWTGREAWSTSANLREGWEYQLTLNFPLNPHSNFMHTRQGW